MPSGGLPPLHESQLPREHALYRPRHGVHQRAALIAALVFFLLPTLGYAVGVRPAEVDNRRLVDFPSVLDGWGFYTGLSKWATDHLPLRKEAINAADSVSRGVFGEPPPFGNNKQQQPPGVQPQYPTEEVGHDTLSMPQVVEGKNGFMYYGDDIVSRCTGKNNLDKTIQQLRKLREGVEASGRKFVVLIAPDKSTIVPEYLPDSYLGKDCRDKSQQNFWPRISEVGPLDVRAQLENWGKELGRPVYPPLDGHWNDEGGVVMARSIAEAIQPGVSRTWGIELGDGWKDGADIPTLLGRRETIEGNHYLLKPNGRTDLVREVSANFSEPKRLNTAFGTGTVRAKVGLLGDSFTIRSLRYLAAAFQDITVLHYGKVGQDNGRAAAEMLADNEVVAVELVERTLHSGNNLLLQPNVVDGIVKALKERPLR